MTRPDVISASIPDDPQAREVAHVHNVYDEIAHHFSATRHKPWPIVSMFLSSLPAGSIGLDSGTGNGKYLPLPLARPGSIWTIGLDRSQNLLNIARRVGNAGPIREVVLGDALGQGWRRAVFDYAISIATIHHLATHERRKEAIERLIQCVSPTHGRILIFVWAVEQDELSKRSVPTAPSNVDEGGINESGQDVFVPWVLSKEHQERTQRSELETSIASLSARTDQVFLRYYHLFSEGELVKLVHSAAEELGLEVAPSPTECSIRRRGVAVIQEGWERSNYYVELKCWEC